MLLRNVIPKASQKYIPYFPARLINIACEPWRADLFGIHRAAWSFWWRNVSNSHVRCRRRWHYCNFKSNSDQQIRIRLWLRRWFLMHGAGRLMNVTSPFLIIYCAPEDNIFICRVAACRKWPSYIAMLVANSQITGRPNWGKHISLRNWQPRFRMSESNILSTCIRFTENQVIGRKRCSSKEPFRSVDLRCM